MKTLFINGSPKKKGSISRFLMKMAASLTSGEKVFLQVRTAADREKALESLQGADAVVFSLPLYVDGIPSHLLRFLEVMEARCRAEKLTPRVYALSNSGFIEGRQNQPLMQVLENFCERSGLGWMGGVGIGGGVMLNVMRILLMVYAGIFALNVDLSGIQSGVWLPPEAFAIFGKQLGIVLIFSAGVLFYVLRLSLAIRRGKSCGTGYTRVLVPSFLFILMADIFFTVISLFQGGLFRGWLAKK